MFLKSASGLNTPTHSLMFSLIYEGLPQLNW